MKTKIFKKIIAMMIVASSVMSISGVAMAAKKAPENGRSYGASETPAVKKAKRKRRKFVTIKKNLKKGKKNLNSNESESAGADASMGKPRIRKYINPQAPIYIPRYYMPVFSTKIDIYNGDGDSMMSDMLNSIDISSGNCLDDRRVVHITHQIRSFKLNGNLSNLKKCSMEKRVRLTKVLVDWMKAECVGRKTDVMVAIVDLAENGFFDGFESKQKLDIIRTLIKIFEDSRCCGLGSVWVFRRLVQTDFLKGNESSEEILKLKKILSDFEKIDVDEPDIGLDYGIDDGNDKSNDGLNFFDDDCDDDDLDI